MRTQCEAEKLYESSGSKLAFITGGLKFASDYVPNVFLGGVLDLFSRGFGVYTISVELKRSRLEDGCTREMEEKNKAASAAQAGGTPPPSGGGSDGHHGAVGGGNFRGCYEIFHPATTSAEGEVHGGHFHVVCPPIALDLDGDGIEYRTMQSPIYTDVDADGRTEIRAWVGSDDGLLFYDVNADGIGQHLETVLTSFVEGAHTDLDALRVFDTNENGAIDAGDSYFTSLKVGRDLNQNGKFEANEVATLAQHGIARIDLVTGIQHLMDHDNPTEQASGAYEFHAGQFVRRRSGRLRRMLRSGRRHRVISHPEPQTGLRRGSNSLKFS